MTVIVNGSKQAGVRALNLDPSFSAGNVLAYTFMYSFAVQGGAQSALALTDINGAAQTIPNKSIIIGAWIEEFTQVTGGAGATVALGYTGSAAGFLAATLVSNATFATPGTVTTTLVTGALPVKATQALSVTATPAVNNLTAGIFYIRVLTLPGA